MINLTETTKDAVYASYLIENQKSLRSKVLQFPYRTHLKFLHLGKTLDIGCGAGRNLKALKKGSVGIDHNGILVQACREAGLSCFLTDEFLEKKENFQGQFDTILLAHVAEHMKRHELQNLLAAYLLFLKPKSRIVVICPQEKGFASDKTHVEFMDFDRLTQVLIELGFRMEKKYSFPFPRWAGTFFAQNEFIVIARKG